MSSNAHVKICFVHEFLGQTKDWIPVIDSLEENFELRTESLCLDLWNDETLGPHLSFQQWVNEYRQRLKAWAGHQPVYLVGSELGGRLLLHDFLQRSWEYAGACFLSVHPGFLDATERQKRWLEDQVWADRFELDPWSEVLGAWNSQPAFAGSPSILRAEREFDRVKMAESFRRWSVSKQELDGFLQVDPPVMWVVGENDPELKEQIGRLEQTGAPGIYRILKNCGRRLLSDAPEQIAQSIGQFIRDVEYARSQVPS